MAGLNAAQAQALAVAGDPAQTCLAAIEGQHLPLIAHEFRQVRALAPRGRAGIQHPLTGLGIEQWRNRLSRSVLNAPVPLVVTGQMAQITGAALDGQAHRQTLDRFGHHPRRGQGRLNRLLRGAQAVNPKVQGRRRVAGPREGLRLLRGLPLQERRREPIRQGLANGQGRHRITRQGQGLAGLLAAQESPQHAVDHRGQPAQAAALGQLHRGADGG